MPSTTGLATAPSDKAKGGAEDSAVEEDEVATRADPATITCSSTNTTSNKPADLTPKAATQHLPPPQLREVMQHAPACNEEVLAAETNHTNTSTSTDTDTDFTFLVLKALSHPGTPPPPPKTYCMYTAQEPHTQLFALRSSHSAGKEADLFILLGQQGLQ